jgi:hypothetical protein
MGVKQNENAYAQQMLFNRLFTPYSEISGANPHARLVSRNLLTLKRNEDR